ncbi:hypothetical protein KMP13_15180 [Epibacterium ulvae]|uniref:hypothetical protein n=1 Tax=Epibacterium ulvae TaxID=1156985 RepID=UPI001BFC2E37|nr:hypothetical protein [Epibacterium ulvae]MBT8155186.1 hypothetical protein [Epibacterium ulvae]
MKHQKKFDAKPDSQIRKTNQRPSVRFPDACSRSPNEKEQRMDQSGADRDEVTCIQIARYYFNTFSNPHSQTWMRAFSTAEEHFDYSNGPVIASLVARVLDAVRQSRRSCFMFNNPACANCADILTEHERRLLTALSSLRRGGVERAELELMMLCEGNDTARVMMWLRELALALPQLPARPTTVTHH